VRSSLSGADLPASSGFTHTEQYTHALGRHRGGCLLPEALPDMLSWESVPSGTCQAPSDILSLQTKAKGQTLNDLPRVTKEAGAKGYVV
jgi:hypothetical protein